MKPAATNAVVRVASAPAVRSASAAGAGSFCESAGIAVPPESETAEAIPAACAGGRPTAFRPDSVWEVSPAASVAPRIAIPSAEPTWREVDWIPEPWPERSFGHVRQDHARQLRRREPDAEAVEEERRDEPPGGDVRPDEHGVEDEPDRLEAEPEARDGPRADPLRERRRGAAGEERPDRRDGERGARLERREAEDALQVERDREHEPELAEARRSAPPRSRPRSCAGGRGRGRRAAARPRRSIARKTTRNSGREDEREGDRRDRRERPVPAGDRERLIRAQPSVSSAPRSGRR